MNYLLILAFIVFCPISSKVYTRRSHMRIPEWRIQSEQCEVAPENNTISDFMRDHPHIDQLTIGYNDFITSWPLFIGYDFMQNETVNRKIYTKRELYQLVCFGEMLLFEGMGYKRNQENPMHNHKWIFKFYFYNEKAQSVHCYPGRCFVTVDRDVAMISKDLDWLQSMCRRKWRTLGEIIWEMVF